MMSESTFYLIFIPIVIAIIFLKWYYDKKLGDGQEMEFRSNNKFYRNAGETKKIEFFVNDELKKPLPFGFKINWLAIKSNNIQEVGQALNNNRKIYSTNMEYGIHGAYDTFTFVTPPIDGWIIVMRPPFYLEDQDGIAKLEYLSKQFGEVHFYGNHRVSSYGAFAKFINGIMIRGFSMADEIYLNEGILTPIEEDILSQGKQEDINESNESNPEEQYFYLSDEESICEIAGAWSINPLKLDQYEVNELGIIF